MLQKNSRVRPFDNHFYRQIVRLIADVHGQFTLEAALTLPVILLSSLAILWLATVMYAYSGLFYTADQAAERTTFVWDNSRKALSNGAVDPMQTDGLYWRLTGDGIGQWFNLTSPFSPVQVDLPQSTASVPADGVSGKLLKTASSIDPSLQGKVTFQHFGIFRQVGVSLQRKLRLPDVVKRWITTSELGTDAKSYVADPLETIRLTDLTRTFISEIQGRIKPKAALDAMVQPAGELRRKESISSHAQAAQYVRLLVNGSETTFEVKPGTERVVDALDASGVAHQAFYTFNEKNLREVQMVKDAELLKKGKQIKGVVWHFFVQSGQSKVTLPPVLKNELERNGIVVVFHS